MKQHISCDHIWKYSDLGACDGGMGFMIASCVKKPVLLFDMTSKKFRPRPDNEYVVVHNKYYANRWKSLYFPHVNITTKPKCFQTLFGKKT